MSDQKKNDHPLEDMLSQLQDALSQATEAAGRDQGTTGDEQAAAPGEQQISDLLPVLPVRDVVVFNYMILPLFIGREKSVKAVEAVDDGVGKVVEATSKMGGVSLITADHGNAERMVDTDGEPFTAHTTNLVPFYIVGASVRLRDGRLADIAPTMLPYIGLPVPAEMTGKSIIVE